MVFLSVIIIAYNRQEFLKYSVESVLNQTLPNKEYEIIIVKNFTNEMDEYFCSQGIRILKSQEKEIGPKLADAITICEGEVILFLDDDDRFLPGKLMHVYNLFKQNINLGYYRNNFQIIDNVGVVKQSNFFKTSRKKLSFLGSYYVVRNQKERRLKKMFEISFEALPSCISVRKRILTDKLNYLKKLDLSQDWFSFYAAVTSKFGMETDNLILTEYRIHSKNTSLSYDLSGMGEFFRRLTSSYFLILEMMKGEANKKTRKIIYKNAKYHYSKYAALSLHKKYFLLIEFVKTWEYEIYSEQFNIVNFFFYVFYILMLFINTPIFINFFQTKYKMQNMYIYSLY